MAKCFVNHFFRVLYYRKPGFFSHRFYNVNLPQDMSVAFLKNVVVSEFFWHFYYMPPFELKSISEFLSFVMKQLQGIFFHELNTFYWNLEILSKGKERDGHHVAWSFEIRKTTACSILPFVERR